MYRGSRFHVGWMRDTLVCDNAIPPKPRCHSSTLRFVPELLIFINSINNNNLSSHTMSTCYQTFMPIEVHVSSLNHDISSLVLQKIDEKHNNTYCDHPSTLPFG